MLSRIRRSSKGFTLVEVIVVAVIVAVLALVAIQLYRGYVTESRQNTAENLAASAASFIESAININPTLVGTFGNLDGANAYPTNSWVIDMPAATAASGAAVQTVFTCPVNAVITVTGNSVTATIAGTATSSPYPFSP